jgi:hypothetical protein
MNIERSLKLVLRADAIVCWAYVALVAVFSGTFASELVVNSMLAASRPTPLSFVFLGVFVATVGCYSWWITIHWPKRLGQIHALVLVEILSCLACIALLAFGADQLKFLGSVFVIASGFGVFAFLVRELLLYIKFSAQQGIQPDGPASGGSAD